MFRICVIFILTFLTLSASAYDDFNVNRIGNAFLSPSLMDIELRDDLAFCADEYGFSIWDISNLENPEIIGQCSTRGDAVSCAIFGDYAYVSDVGHGVAVIDISEPDNPVVINYLEMLIRYQWWGQAAPPEIIVRDNLLYICGGVFNGLYIADLEDPENPELINYYSSLGIDAIQFHNDITYLIGSIGSIGFHILDISDPRDIAVIDTINLQYGPFGFTIQDDMMAIWSTNSGLFLYSLEDPEQPEQIGWSFAGHVKFELSDDYAYGIRPSEHDVFKAVTTFDVSIPEEIEWIEGEPGPFASGHDMVLDGENLFIASHNRGVGVVSLADPEEPVLLNEWEDYSTISYVTVSGDYAYLSDQYFGIRIIDISDPQNTVHVGSFEAELRDGNGIEEEVFNSIYIDGHLYVFFGNRGFSSIFILDVSNPEEPQQVEFAGYSYTYSSHFIVDNYLCLVGWHSVRNGRDRSFTNIQVFDMSEPGNLELVFQNDVENGSSFHSSSDGNNIYMSDWDRLNYKMDVYSVADITEPEFLGTWDLQDWFGLFLVHNGIMYTQGNSNEIIVYDLSNPMEPEIIDRIDLDMRVGGRMVLEGDMIYFDISGSGFYCMSIADPRHPEIVGYYDTPGNVEWIDGQDDYIYVADKYEMGIYQFEDDGGVDDRFTIRLAPGWNIISSPFDPFEPAIESIFSRIVNRRHLFIVKDYQGRFYFPGQFNNIPDWDVNQGYQVKVTAIESVRIFGDEVAVDRPIDLPENWSMVSYFPVESIEAPVALSNIEDELLIAKDGSGNFYLPEFDFNSIPPMHRGAGYKIKTTEAVELVWNVGEERQAGNRIIQPDPVHFTAVTRTNGNMSVLLCDVIFDGEVGVFTKDGLCVGASVTTAGDVGLAVWGDDPTTDEIDGAIQGESMIFKLWDGENEHDVAIEVTEGNSVWELNGLLIGSLGLQNELPVEFGITSAYPNPFNSTVQLRYGLSVAGKVDLKIYDISGREVVTLIDGNNKTGIHSVSWNASGVATGLYFARLEQAGNVVTKKLLLVK